MELTVGKPYVKELMADEDDERSDGASVWFDPCNIGVGEMEGDKVENDDAGEDMNDGNDDVESFIVFVVVIV